MSKFNLQGINPSRIVAAMLLMAASLSFFDPLTAKAQTALSPALLVRELERGLYGEDVQELQKFLNTSGFIVASEGLGSSGSETTFFGDLTLSALKRFQEAYPETYRSVGLGKPSGYFGPATRSKVLEVVETLPSIEIVSPSLQVLERIFSYRPYVGNEVEPIKLVFEPFRDVAESIGQSLPVTETIIETTSEQESNVVNFIAASQVSTTPVSVLQTATQTTRSGSNPSSPVYTLTYLSDANGSISGNSSQEILRGRDGTAVTAIPNAGYTFVQWSDGSTANPRTDTGVLANLSVTASYTSSAEDLTGLAISGSPANYTFSGNTYTYTGLTVLNDVSSITVTPTGSGTITVDGVAVTSGQASGAIALTEAVEKTITVVVAETGKTSKTYTIRITRSLRIAETPTFSPVAGAIAFGSTVTISSTGADAIYYTTDGSTPTTSSTNQATTPLVINSAVTVKALAVKSGYTNSAIASAAYTQAATADLTGLAFSGSPTGYTFAGGTYTYSGITIGNAVSSITVTPTGTGTITVDGTPVTSGQASGAISLTAGVQKTITVVATETGKTAKTYTINITRNSGVSVTPTFSPVAGAVAFGTAVTISSAGADAIYYTTDGSTPTTSSTNQATTPLVINSAVTVKALAVKATYDNSAIATAAYTQAATADLTSLVLSNTPGNYTFSGSTYTYNSVTVATGVSSITVTPTGSGVITVDGVTVTSGQASSAISLTAGVEKTITVVATETGKSAKTYTINVTRAIAVPTGLAASAVSTSQINLSWTNTDGTAQTRIYRAGVLVTTVAAGVTTYNNTGLSEGTNYVYLVKHYLNSAESASSTSANATTWYAVDVAAVGGGGGGAGITYNDFTPGGGGGAGGGTSRDNAITIVPGKTYTVTVGSGGSGGNGGNGSSGGVTSFVNTTDSITLVRVNGGSGGIAPTAEDGSPSSNSSGGTISVSQAGATNVVGGYGGAGTPLGGGTAGGINANGAGGGGSGSISNNGGTYVGATGGGSSGTSAAGGTGGRSGDFTSISATNGNNGGGTGGGRGGQTGSMNFPHLGAGGGGGGGGALVGSDYWGGGGGGGGGRKYEVGTSIGGAGGQGVVVIRYLGTQKGTGGTVTSSGGYTIHTFTSSGTFTP